MNNTISKVYLTVNLRRDDIGLGGIICILFEISCEIVCCEMDVSEMMFRGKRKHAEEK